MDRRAVKGTRGRVDERDRMKGARRRPRPAAARIVQGVCPGVVGTVPTLPIPGFTPLVGLALPGAGVDRRWLAVSERCRLPGAVIAVPRPAPVVKPLDPPAPSPMPWPFPWPPPAAGPAPLPPPPAPPPPPPAPPPPPPPPPFASAGVTTRAKTAKPSTKARNVAMGIRPPLRALTQPPTQTQASPMPPFRGGRDVNDNNNFRRDGESPLCRPRNRSRVRV